VWSEFFIDGSNPVIADIPVQSYHVAGPQANYHMPGQGWYFFDCSGGSIVATLPTPLGGGQATPCFCKRFDAVWLAGASVTINAPVGYTLQDGTNLTVLSQQGQSATIAADTVSITEGVF